MAIPLQRNAPTASMVATSQGPPAWLSEIANRLLQYEIAGEGSANPDAGFHRVCAALHHHLSPAISASGYRSVLARALKLAAADFPSLAGVSVARNADCSVSGIPERSAQWSSDQRTEAYTAAIAYFIWLLTIFIGEHLGVGTIREIWPDIPIDSANSSVGRHQ